MMASEVYCAYSVSANVCLLRIVQSVPNSISRIRSGLISGLPLY